MKDGSCNFKERNQYKINGVVRVVYHCIKSAQIWSIFWSVFSSIQTRKNSVLGHFPHILFTLAINWKKYNDDIISVRKHLANFWLSHFSNNLQLLLKFCFCLQGNWPEIQNLNSLLLEFSNIWRLGWLQNTKFGINVSNIKLFISAKMPGLQLLMFLKINKGKREVKIPLPPSLSLISVNIYAFLLPYLNEQVFKTGQAGIAEA